MPSISQRGAQTPLSPFRKLVPLAEGAKSRGLNVFHLNIGQPDIPTPPAALKALQAAMPNVVAYSAAEGNWGYRVKLAEYYRRFGVVLQPEHILVTTCASEALYLGMLSCFNKGDEIITPEPFYANYNGFAHMADVVLKPITSSIANGFALPAINDFERQIGPRTKGILICNPNNPTGCLYPQATLEALGTLAVKHDLFLFVDEVYREFAYDGQEFYSALRLERAKAHVVMIDSVSKRYSACGARIGALVSFHPGVAEAVSRYAKLRLSPPAFGQMLAEAALEDDAAYLDAAKQEYDRRRQTVFRRLQQMPGVKSYLPGGAFYCFAELPVDDAEHFCRWLLEDFQFQGSTVMLSPGAAFYATPGLGLREVRIAYILDRQSLEIAMDVLAAALEVYPGRTTVG